MGLFASELSYRERLTLAWPLTWPAVAMDVAWSFLAYVVLALDQKGAELAYLIPYLLLVAPWLVRRMFRLPHPGFRLKTLIGGEEVEMGYTESFKVMWLLSWRVSVLTLLLLFAVSLILRFVQVDLASLVPSSREAPFLNMAGASILENGAALLLLPLVMPGMFHKRYQGFRVAVERKSAPAPRAVAPPRPKRKPGRKS